MCLPSRTDTVVVELECFQSARGLIVKELAVASSATSAHFIFRPPHPFWRLDAKYRNANRWLIRNWHGLRWTEGSVDYSQLGPLLRSTTYHAQTVYVKGGEKQKLVSQVLGDEGKNVVDLGSLDCPKIAALSYPQRYCYRHAGNKHCALYKACCFADWLADNVEDGCGNNLLPVADNQDAIASPSGMCSIM
jgi:hypothetical protein